MKPYVLDSSAMLAYLFGEPGAEVVDLILKDSQAVCYAHAINLCEVFYDFVRSSDVTNADQIIKELYAVGIIEQSTMTSVFWRKVGLLKAKGRISLADCFCIALAQDLEATVLTADHHEFDAIAEQNLVSIKFIR